LGFFDLLVSFYSKVEIINRLLGFPVYFNFSIGKKIDDDVEDDADDNKGITNKNSAL